MFYNAYALYMIPAAALVAGAFLGVTLGPRGGLAGDPAALLGAIAGLLIGLGFSRAAGRRMADNPRYVPTLIEINKE